MSIPFRSLFFFKTLVFSLAATASPESQTLQRQQEILENYNIRIVSKTALGMAANMNEMITFLDGFESKMQLAPIACSSPIAIGVQRENYGHGANGLLSLVKADVFLNHIDFSNLSIIDQPTLSFLSGHKSFEKAFALTKKHCTLLEDEKVMWDYFKSLKISFSSGLPRFNTFYTHNPKYSHWKRTIQKIYTEMLEQNIQARNSSEPIKIFIATRSRDVQNKNKVEVFESQKGNKIIKVKIGSEEHLVKTLIDYYL